MTKWLLVCGVVAAAAYVADTVSAQEQIAPPQGTVVTSGDTVNVMPARRGLFGRWRERRGMVTYSGYNGVVYTTTPGTMTSGTIAQTYPSGIQQAQAIQSQPRTVQTQPMTTTTTQVATQSNYVERRGLFPRLRYRLRGY